MYLFGTFCLRSAGKRSLRRIVGTNCQANGATALETDFWDMKQQQSIQLYKYWLDLYKQSGVPERTQIEPMAIRGILGDTFILEGGRNNRFFYRLAGTRLCAAFGHELKGQEFNAPWQGKEQQTITNIIGSVAENGQAVVMGNTATTFDNRTISMETLLLPLLHNGYKFERLIGVTSTTTMPYWLGTDLIFSMALTSLRIVDPAHLADSFGTRFVKPKAREEADVMTIRPTGRKVGHLTVLQGGKSNYLQGIRQ